MGCPGSDGLLASSFQCHYEDLLATFNFSHLPCEGT